MTSMDSQATTVAQSDSSQETMAGADASFGMRAGGDAPSHDHGDQTTPTLRDARDWQTFQSLEVCAEYLDELRENMEPSPARGSVDSAQYTIDDRLRDVIRCDRRVVQVLDVDEHLALMGSCVFSRFRWRMEHGLIQMAYGNGCDANKHIPMRLPLMHKVRTQGGNHFYVHSVCRRCSACCFLRIDILAGSKPLAPEHGDMMQELKDTMNAITKTVSTLQSTVDNHSRRIESISSASGSSAPPVHSDIEQLQSNIAACSQKLETAMTTLSAQAGRIDGIAATNQAAHGTLHALTAKVNLLPPSFPFYPPFNNSFNAANIGTGAPRWPSQQAPTSSALASTPLQATPANSQAPQSFASILQPSGSAQNGGNVTRSMPQPTKSSMPDSIFLQNIPVTDPQQMPRSADSNASSAASSQPPQPDPPASPARSAAQAMITMANSESTKDSHTRTSKRARGSH